MVQSKHIFGSFPHFSFVHQNCEWNKFDNLNHLITSTMPLSPPVIIYSPSRETSTLCNQRTISRTPRLMLLNLIFDKLCCIFVIIYSPCRETSSLCNQRTFSQTPQFCVFFWQFATTWCCWIRFWFSDNFFCILLCQVFAQRFV